MSDPISENDFSSHPSAEIAGSDSADVAMARMVRTARALIGAMPTQLGDTAARLRPKGRIFPDRPLSSCDGLRQMVRAIMGWYQDDLGLGVAERNVARCDTASLEGIIIQYRALLSEWESRKALSLAKQMSDESGLRHGANNQPEAAAPLAPGRRQALLVDDHPDVLVAVGSFIESFGFGVVTTSDADLALKLLASGPPVDLLVTDYSMPGMTGRDLAAQACQAYPSLRALIITGYADAKELSVLPDRVRLLAKPFRRAALSASIDVLLEPEPASIPDKVLLV